MTPLSEVDALRADLDQEALDLIHALLGLPRFQNGIQAHRIARYTGLGIGYVQNLLKSSTLVIKRAPLHPRLWLLDWSDVEPQYRHVQRGRPSAPLNGKPALLTSVLQQHWDQLPEHTRAAMVEMCDRIAQA